MATARFFFPVLLLGFFFLSSALPADAQRAAAKDLAKIRKTLKKDTTNVEAKLAFARYFLSEGNPGFDTDSAYRYAQRALYSFTRNSPKQKERLQKLGIDSLSILRLRSQVDSVAYAHAREVNTKESYSFFINHYPSSIYHLEAIELRDEVAYLEVLRSNTIDGYKNYVSAYPNSLRVKDAEGRYEQLVFKEKTASGNVDDYKSFLVQFPESMFREQTEKYIFEVTTSSGLIDDYINFVKEYPSGSQSSKAKNILYYLFRDAGKPRPSSFDNDSLRMLDQRNEGYWVPFYKNALYGFMNEDGDEVMAPQFQSIDSTYLCGNLTGDFLVTSSGVYSRSGALLLKKMPTRATDLGNGFLNIIDGTCQTIVHQSGFQVGGECVEDAHILADQFIAVKKSKGWNVYAFNSKPLLTSFYDGITSVDKVIVLKRYGKNIVVKASQIAAISPTTPLDESLVFDEVKAWGEGNLWVKNGVLEGVIGQDLQFIIPLDRQLLVKTSFGFTKKKDNKVQVTGILPDLETNRYDVVNDYGDWIELRTGKKSSLYRVSQKKIVASNLDSTWIKNRVAFGVKNDSLNVYAGANRLASFERSAPVTFIKSADSVVYFWVSDKKQKVVYEASQGKKLFSSDFEEIEVIAKDLFLFSRKNRQNVLKKGIFRRDGKIAQPAEYDAIIPSSNGYLSLLKEKKFGLYNTKNQKLIRPQYERNVLPYGSNYFIAYKGGYGIITANEEPVTGFDFEEIKYWNDHEAWVKNNFLWSIVSIKDKSLRLSKIRSFQTIKDHDGEMIVRVQQENYFGIVSNKKGVVITPTFTEIINVGSDDKPFYFTEKRVEEAEIYVVIYYNSQGKLVKKQVYEDAEYEKIYCEN